MKTISEKVAALLLICLTFLAITGYAYSHWTDIANIFSTANMGRLEITIENEKVIPPEISYFKPPSNKSVYIEAFITTGWQIWIGTIIKNKGTLPATITYKITTNLPDEGYFGNETHFYGPYATSPPSEVWCDLNQTNLPPPAGEKPTPIDLSVGEKLVVWQKIWVTTTPPSGYTITITSDYFATLGGWHDTVAVVYKLTMG